MMNEMVNVESEGVELKGTDKSAAELLSEFCKANRVMIVPQIVGVQSRDTGVWGMQVQLLVDYQKDQDNGINAN